MTARDDEHRKSVVAGNSVRASWVRRLLKQAGGAVLFIVLVLVLLEVVARIYFAITFGEPLAFYRRFGYDRVPLLGFEMVPNQPPHDSITLKTRYSTNSEGFRGQQEYGAKAPGEVRVAVLGESSVFGYGATNDDTTIAADLKRDLEQRLGKVPISTINAGNPAYLSYQVLARLQLRVLDKAPDYAVIYSGWNDFMMSVRAEHWHPNIFHGEDIYFGLDSWNIIIADQNSQTRIRALRQSATLNLVHKALGGLFNRNKPHLGSVAGSNERRLEIPPPLFAAVSRQFEQNLRSQVAVATAQGITPVLCTLMSRDHAYEEIRARVNDIVRRVAHDGHAILVDTEQLVGPHAPPDYFNADDGYHLSDAGNAVVADAVAAALVAARAQSPAATVE